MGRLSFIDTAKFLAIYFVIISHCSMSSNIAHFLFSFHVPLFFVLYGYVYRIQEKQTVKFWLFGGGKKLIYRVLVPYFLLAFILGSPFSIKNLCFVGYGAIQALNNITSTHLWFLPCYFISVLIYNMVIYQFKDNKILQLSCFLLLVVISALTDFESNICWSFQGKTLYFTGNGQSCSNQLYLGMPFALNVAFSGCLFIYIGSLIRKCSDRFLFLDKTSKSLYVFVATIIIGFLSFIYNDGDEKLLAMSLAEYGNYVLFVLTVICFSIATIILAKWIDNPLFAKYGKYTMPIYGFHLVLTFIPKLFYKFLGIPIESHLELKGILSGSVVLFVACLLIPIIRNIDSNLIGEHK